MMLVSNYKFLSQKCTLYRRIGLKNHSDSQATVSTVLSHKHWVVNDGWQCWKLTPFFVHISERWHMHFCCVMKSPLFSHVSSTDSHSLPPSPPPPPYLDGVVAEIRRWEVNTVALWGGELPLPTWLHKQCVKLSGEYKLSYLIRMWQG